MRGMEVKTSFINELQYLMCTIRNDYDYELFPFM
jgi:hypothetical protein